MKFPLQMYKCKFLNIIIGNFLIISCKIIIYIICLLYCTYQVFYFIYLFILSHTYLVIITNNESVIEKKFVKYFLTVNNWLLPSILGFEQQFEICFSKSLKCIKI